MAETKKQAGGGRVATPNPKPGSQSVDVEALSKAVGARIKVTTSVPGIIVDGTLFSLCKTTSLLAIKDVNSPPAPPTPSSSAPANYHLVSLVNITAFEILQAAGEGEKEQTIPALTKAENDAFSSREAQAIREAKKWESTRGKGVSKEAQDIHDHIMRTLPTRWNNQQIIINDAVVLEPPYKVENCKAPKEKSAALQQIKKVVEGYWNKRQPQTKGAQNNRGPAPSKLNISPSQIGLPFPPDIGSLLDPLKHAKDIRHRFVFPAVILSSLCRLKTKRPNSRPIINGEHPSSSSTSPNGQGKPKLSWGTRMRLQNGALAKENQELRDKVKSQEETIAHLRAMLAKQEAGLQIGDTDRVTPAKQEASLQVEATNKVTLLTLPVEIRLHIYDLLLIGRYRFDPAQPLWIPLHMHGVEKRMKINTDRPHGAKKYLEPAILRTCKQINQEATPILYGKNLFDLTPRDFTHLVKRAGIANISLIKSLAIHISFPFKVQDYFRMIQLLASRVRSLRHLEVRFHTTPNYGRPGFHRRGHGDNPELVRALTQIRNLNSLLIEGDYAKTWPEYLQRTMGVAVTSYRGLRYEMTHGSDSLNGPSEHQRKIEAKYEAQFESFQEGCSGLAP
ncbi:hypothetical protein FKW77_007795 [Venturia effusa]|uniref:AD domain-containing protein n=1 Tax=Venturia effusa TaxID=50376 RepID=A0A517L7R2_9PEZI|nr:hypothetical protein FKW77_007795 [Venturia effusa]